MIDIVNLQRTVGVDLATYRSFLIPVLSALIEAENKTVSIAFVSDRRMRELNKLFRGKDSTTDVLSFPHEPDEFESKSSPPYEGGVDAASADGVVLSRDDKKPENHLPAKAVLLVRNEESLKFLGDIVISAEQANKQAIDNKLSLENEIKQLILHGVLHLCGYDHETDNGEMNARELELRDELGI